MQTGATTSLLSALPPDAAAEKLREELEMVAYVTSHDLQAPLRIIQSYCEELNAHPNLATDAESRLIVQSLQQEAARMKALMEALLDYIRLDTFFPKHSLLDSNEVVAQAMSTLQDEINTTGANITYEGLPQVMGHRGRLTRLFSYLIDNALKFRSRGVPHIRITAQRQGAMWQFAVEDNGIGINEEHQDIIFRLFQRLHTGEEYPGNGVGLALARKIAEAHGGKLWVESAPEKGSRFMFTLSDR